MDNDDVKLKHKGQIRRKKPEKKGYIASIIDFIKANRLKLGLGILLVGVAITLIAILSKNHDKVLPPPPVDTLTQVVDSPAVEKKDSATSIENINPVNEGVDTKQNDASAETPEVIEKPKVDTATESTPSVNTRSGDVTVDAKKAIRGDFGNGAERRRQLGNDYEQVQALVNKMYRDGNLHW